MRATDPLEAAVHAHIVALAEEYRISTDEVMLMIGIVCRDFSTCRDPRFQARVARIKCRPELRRSLRDAVSSMIAAVRTLAARPTRRED